MKNILKESNVEFKIGNIQFKGEAHVFRDGETFEIGKNALYLKLVHQVAGRYLKDRTAGKAFFGSSQSVFDYLFHSMRDLKREVFKVLFLNRKNELILDQVIFEKNLCQNRQLQGSF